MEDRLTPELWLDLGADEADAADHVGPGQTVWSNARPNRRDLPRTIEEFEALVVHEAAPETGPAEGVTRLHFRRTPRPGQGIQTGEPTIGLLLVLISPKHPDEAQALRDWADFVHIRHIAAASVPGYGMITPYERVDQGSPGRFMHFYEIHSPDAEAVFRSMVPLVVERIGEPGTASFDTWAGHPALRIDYVNTFRRRG